MGGLNFFKKISENFSERDRYPLTYSDLISFQRAGHFQSLFIYRSLRFFLREKFTPKMKECNKTTWTLHAKERLQERTTISDIELAHILDNNKAVTVGHEYQSNRYSRLVFSPADKEFFIAVQDAKSGTVVTILTIEYWNNLSEKHFDGELTKNDGTHLIPWKKKITKNELQLAASLSNPESKFAKKNKLSSSISITGTYEYSNHPKHISLGSIKTSQLLNQSDSLIETELSEKIKNKLSTRNMSESDLVSINWKFKHDKKPKFYICQENLDLKKLIKTMRISVSNKIKGANQGKA